MLSFSCGDSLHLSKVELGVLHPATFQNQEPDKYIALMKLHFFILPSLLMCTKQVQYHEYLQEKIVKKCAPLSPFGDTHYKVAVSMYNKDILGFYQRICNLNIHN